MAIEVIDFFDTNDEDKKYWIEEISKGQGEANGYLAQLLQDNKLKSLCGDSTKLLLLTENHNLYSFCTIAEQDEINAPDLTPWIGFVYTFPEYRGTYYASTLVDIACDKIKEMGFNQVYISPSTDTRELYEKLGFTRLDYTMETIYGYDTFVYKKNL